MPIPICELTQAFNSATVKDLVQSGLFLTCLNLALFSEPVGFTDNVLKEVHVEKQLKKSTADASSGSFGPVGSSHAGGGFISPTGSCH